MIRLMELAHGTCWLLICFDLMILNKTDTKYGIQLLHKPNLPVSWALRTLAKKVCVWLIQGIQFWYTPIFIHFHGKRWWQPTGFPVAHGSLGTSFQSPRTRRSADKFSLESTDSDWIILDSRQGVMLVTGSTPDTKPQYKVFCTQNLFEFKVCLWLPICWFGIWKNMDPLNTGHRRQPLCACTGSWVSCPLVATMGRSMYTWGAWVAPWSFKPRHFPGKSPLLPKEMSASTSQNVVYFCWKAGVVWPINSKPILTHTLM